MNNKTKIVVLHMREIIYIGIFAFLAIILLVVLIAMFLPKSKKSQPTEDETAECMESNSTYLPGVYTTPLNLGSTEISIQVVIDETGIIAVDSPDADQDISTLYPLLQPAIDDLEAQIIAKQSTENLYYTDDSKYTSLSVIAAVDQALLQAKKSCESPSLSQD